VGNRQLGDDEGDDAEARPHRQPEGDEDVGDGHQQEESAGGGHRQGQDEEDAGLGRLLPGLLEFELGQLDLRADESLQVGDGGGNEPLEGGIAPWGEISHPILLDCGAVG